MPGHGWALERFRGVLPQTTILLLEGLPQTVFYPGVLRELLREQRGHGVEDPARPHLEEALAWLARAQDAAGGGGFARGYSLRPDGSRPAGWQPAYPETTGYIIPTLFQAADHLGRPELAERALRAARWEIELQLPAGAVQGSVVGRKVSPAAFNTGQVIFGWLAAFERTGDLAFAEATRRAGRYLIQALNADDLWHGLSAHAARNDALYNAQTAWALAEAGARLGEPAFTDAAVRNLRAVVARQRADGWLPECCINDVERPLLHTLAYALRGLLEAGRLLSEPRFIKAAASAAGALAAHVRSDGWMAGRFGPGWRPMVAWSCLTGQAQMANNWMRLQHITGEGHWLEPVPRVLCFLKTTQNRDSADPGLRGGIKGSAPLTAAYGRWQVLSWATKYFADALLRSERLEADRASAAALDIVLA